MERRAALPLLGWPATVKSATLQAVIHPGDMPGRGTPHASFRVPERLWQRFGEVTTLAGTDRASALRSFIRWYVREPGSSLPDRPEVGKHADGARPA